MGGVAAWGHLLRWGELRILHVISVSGGHLLRLFRWGHLLRPRKFGIKFILINFSSVSFKLVLIDHKRYKTNFRAYVYWLGFTEAIHGRMFYGVQKSS